MPILNTVQYPFYYSTNSMLLLCLIVKYSLELGQQTFSIEGQTVKILGFAGHIVTLKLPNSALVLKQP